MSTRASTRIAGFFTVGLLAVALSACGQSPDGTSTSTANPTPNPTSSMGVPNMEPTQTTKDMAKKVIGMHEKDAIAAIQEIGDSYRIARRDKENFALTMDYRPNRINLEIDNDIVTAANIG